MILSKYTKINWRQPYFDVLVKIKIHCEALEITSGHFLGTSGHIRAFPGTSGHIQALTIHFQSTSGSHPMNYQCTSGLLTAPKPCQNGICEESNSLYPAILKSKSESTMSHLIGNSPIIYTIQTC